MSTKMKFDKNKITNVIKWAINPFHNGLTSSIKRTSDKPVSKIREEAK